ncbi:Galactose/methyl galactoside import ATP-binding protein MglA [subsurface metagenome]
MRDFDPHSIFPFNGKVSVMLYIEMRGISKLYPENGVLANDRVDFSVEKNEIHAVVGENGAGKTTLMKILYGLEHPDAGNIFFRGSEVQIRSPLDASRLGIGMVHQHFRLIPDFTVAENVVLGIEPVRHKVFFDRDNAIRRVRAVIEEYGFALDPGLRVKELTVGQMQLVEIIKILYRQAELLILDEPTSVLTEQQIQKLFSTIGSLTDLGKTVIIITHKLGEVKAISNRVTVMRKGRVEAVRQTADVDEKELSRLMVGKSIIFQFAREAMPPGPVVLELRQVRLEQRGEGRALLDGIDLQVRGGEIVGVAGVGGNGLSELEDVVSGLRPVTSGRILHNNEDITRLSAGTLRERGLAYVPADRLFRGSSLRSTVLENMIVSRHHDFLQAGMIQQNRAERFAAELTENFSIDGDPRVPIGTLSGGNIQKVILARELAAHSDFIVFSEPTWGLDVASAEFIYQKLLEIRRRSVAILLISSNLDEILGLADTLIVMYRGRIVGRFSNSKTLSKELIGEYMMGLRDDFKESA